MFARLIYRFFALLIIIALAIGVLLFLHYQKELRAPLQPHEDNQITVVAGANLKSIAKQLQQRGIIAQTWPLIIYARLENKASKIQAGDYIINSGDTVVDLLQDMVDGNVVVYSFTLVEGQTFATLFETLSTHPHLTHPIKDMDAQQLATQLQLEDTALEGWFLPDTYHFNRNSSDIELFKRLHDAMQQYLAQAWQERAQNLPYENPYQALIMASIVEKETAKASERQQVAGVFVRRLQQNMRLQSDPTVIYGRNSRGNKALTKSELKTDTPYNTYKRHGLPPTPIALPSKASIDAALHPDASESLYFVADGKGGHVFSVTYAEHQKAVAAYRKLQDK